jgi:hypothetical protein
VVFVFNGILSTTKKNEMLSFAGKWMELENIILIEVSQLQNTRSHIFSHMWNTDLIQILQYYVKQVMLRGGHIQEGEGKRRKL